MSVIDDGIRIVTARVISLFFTFSYTVCVMHILCLVHKLIILLGSNIEST